MHVLSTEGKKPNLFCIISYLFLFHRWSWHYSKKNHSVDEISNVNRDLTLNQSNFVFQSSLEAPWLICGGGAIIGGRIAVRCGILIGPPGPCPGI